MQENLSGKTFKAIETIGKVSIESNGNTLRLRYRANGKRETIGLGPDTKTARKAAKATAQQIDADITFNRYDASKARYSSRYANKQDAVLIQLPIEPKITLVEIWEHYLTVKGDSLSLSVTKKHFVTLKNLLSKLDADCLLLENSGKFLTEALKHYSPRTIDLSLGYLVAAANLAVATGMIQNHGYDRIKKLANDLVKPEQDSTSRQAFNQGEIQIILDAFKRDAYVKKCSAYKHSFYYPYVMFCALTGCRPSEAIALTWDDVKLSGSQKFVRFNKAYVLGKIKPTKTYETRLFPVNEQLEQCLGLAPLYHGKNEHNLIFPSVKGTYIDQTNYSQRIWLPVLTNLVLEGKIERYLPPYNLRHTFITALVRKGYDVAKIAGLAGNSPDVIFSNYLAVTNDVIPPTLDL